MKAVFRAAWETMQGYCIKDKYAEMTEDKKEEFADKCVELYEAFAEKYMRKDSQVLDRHKVGAIISILGSSENYIRNEKPIGDNDIFLAKHGIPIVVALSLMEQEINKDLRDFGLIDTDRMIDIHIPMPASCTTPYIDSLARILIFEENNSVNNMMRVVEFANTLFLLEECSLIKSGIDMKKWVKLKREQEENNRTQNAEAIDD